MNVIRFAIPIIIQTKSNISFPLVYVTFKEFSILGIEDVGVRIDEVIKNSDEWCFVWELTNTTGDVLLNRIRIELNEEIFALRQSESSVINEDSAKVVAKLSQR